MKIVIKNGTLIDPANGIEKETDITISEGRIASIGQVPEHCNVDEKIDASGLIICPGLIDLCARLREPGEEHKATIASETQAAVAGGITRLVCPPDTSPVIDTPAMVHMIHERANEQGYAIVDPLGALTVGLAGEKLTDMAMLQEAGCAAVSNGLQALDNTLVMRRAMQYASTYDIKVFLTPNDRWLQGNGCVHEGKVSTILGLPAIPEAAETVGVARDLALIETSGVSAHFELISSARTVEMIAEAQQRGLPVSAGVSIHHLHLSEDDIGEFDTRYKVMPPLRSRDDQAALRAGVASGVISAICTDHQPHGADAKLAPFSEAATGIAGLETLLPLTLDLVNGGNLTMSQAIASISSNPAGILGKDCGQLSIGASADICIFDPNENWQPQVENLRTRGRNSPFLGQTMKGRVKWTLVKGNIVYRD